MNATQQLVALELIKELRKPMRKKTRKVALSFLEYIILASTPKTGRASRS
jgi:hypothetical protein